MTGVSAETIRSGFHASGINGHRITLPLLTYKHTVMILEGLLNTKFTAGITAALAYALFWVGGVPLHLEWLLASFSACTSQEELAEKLLSPTVSMSDLLEAVERVKQVVISDPFTTLPHMTLISRNIFSLAMTRSPVDENLLLEDTSRVSRPLSLTDAQDKGLV